MDDLKTNESEHKGSQSGWAKYKEWMIWRQMKVKTKVHNEDSLSVELNTVQEKSPHEGFIELMSWRQKISVHRRFIELMSWRQKISVHGRFISAVHVCRM